MADDTVSEEVASVLRGEEPAIERGHINGPGGVHWPAAMPVLSEPIMIKLDGVSESDWLMASVARVTDIARRISLGEMGPELLGEEIAVEVDLPCMPFDQIFYFGGGITENVE